MPPRKDFNHLSWRCSAVHIFLLCGARHVYSTVGTSRRKTSLEALGDLRSVRARTNLEPIKSVTIWVVRHWSGLQHYVFIRMGDWRWTSTATRFERHAKRGGSRWRVNSFRLEVDSWLAAAEALTCLSSCEAEFNGGVAT